MWVTLDRRGPQLRVEVVDNGVGVDGMITPAEGGLGLTIVSSLIEEELGGTIDIGPRHGEGEGEPGTRAHVAIEVSEVVTAGSDDPTQELPVMDSGD